MRSSSWLRIVAAGCVFVGVLSACGDSSDSGDGASNDTSEVAGYVDAADAVLEQYYQSTDGTPPSAGPIAQTGRDVWVISCGEAAEGCSTTVRAMRESGEVLGWNMTVFDGKFNAENAYATGVRQAVAADADAIVLQGIDCGPVKQALQEAREARIVIVSSDSYDCEDEPLFDGSTIQSEENQTVDAKFAAWGEAKASWLVSQLSGRGKILNIVVVDVYNAQVVQEGFDRVMAACETCDVQPIEVSLADFTSGGVAQKVDDALLRNPDAAAIHAPFDTLVLLGVAPAIERAGMDDVLVMGGEGNVPNLNLIREGRGQSAAIAADPEWWGWATMDTVNRLFAGESPVPQNVGFTAVDAEHNLPPSGSPFRSQVDFKTAYTRIWNGS